MGKNNNKAAAAATETISSTNNTNNVHQDQSSTSTNAQDATQGAVIKNRNATPDELQKAAQRATESAQKGQVVTYTTIWSETFSDGKTNTKYSGNVTWEDGSTTSFDCKYFREIRQLKPAGATEDAAAYWSKKERTPSWRTGDAKRTDEQRAAKAEELVNADNIPSDIYAHAWSMVKASDTARAELIDWITSELATADKEAANKPTSSSKIKEAEARAEAAEQAAAAAAAETARLRQQTDLQTKAMALFMAGKTSEAKELMEQAAALATA